MPFNPLSVSGCMVWYDPSDATTLTLTGGQVSAINDKSGNSHTATATGSTYPALAPLGGRQGLTFIRGTTNVLQTAANITQAQPVTGFCVARETSAIGGSNFSNFVGSDVGAHGPNFGCNVGFFGAGDEVGGYGTIPEDFVIHVWSYVINGASSSIWQDGSRLDSGNAGSNGWSSSRFCLGGNVNPESTTANVNLGEALWYNATLSTANRIAIENYLLTTWMYDGTHGLEAVGSGISLSNPVGFN